MRKRKLKLVVFSILVVALLIFSTLSVATIFNKEGTTKLLIELENDEQIESSDYLQENSDILVDYNNGRVLIEVEESSSDEIKKRYDTSLDETRYKIHLDTLGEVFDRREGNPELDEELMEETGAYIVQFMGPVKSMEWKEQVSKTGASVEREMANHALLVRMDERTKSRVEDLDIVEWIDPYYSGYKLSPELLSPEEDMVRVQVTGWTAEDDVFIREQLNEMGATLGRLTATGNIINVDQSLIPSIAELDGVRSVEPYHGVETKDNVANEIHEVQAGWYPTWSGLPVELTGEGEVVGVQDTGFDEGEIYNGDDGNPDFFQGSGGDRVIRYTDQGGDSDPDGINTGVAHGTHVAGIIGGNGYNWKNHMGLDPASREWHHDEATGVAPEVEFSLDGCSDNRGSLLTDHGYWDGQETDGARVFQNSWGAGSTGDYGTDSEDVDDRMDPYSGSAMDGAPENIIMFSAGNDGPGEHTMTPRPMAKNTIAVGASENYRSGEYSGADNPDYVAEFSSRGGPDFSSGRIKPDVVAAGTAMISALGRGEYEYNDGANPGSWIPDVDEYDTDVPGEGSDGIPDYQYMQGTSMAGPQAAGMAVLTREYYRKVEGVQNPTNPLVKASMINGAERMDPDLYEYPGYAQGWGRPNLKNSLFPDSPQSNQFAEDTFDATGTWDAATDGGMDLEVSSNDVPLKATLNWLDSSGESMNRELHMYAESPSGETYYSGVDNYDENGWTTAGSTNIDGVNTVQRIEIEDPEPGTWTLTVEATNLPSNADFAVVTSADFGPQTDYDVDVSTDYPTTQSLASGGTSHLPIEVANWGNNADDIQLSDTSPGELTVSYDPESTLSLESTEKANVDVLITADTGLTEQVMEFEITGTSQGDTSDPPAADTIRMTIQILTEPLPSRSKVADSDADEMFPEIVSFTDSGGTDWIFAAYQQVTPDGTQPRVKYSEIGADGEPIEWQGPFNPMSNDPTVSPSYIKLQHIDSGTYQDRVVVYWNGETPGSNGEEYEAKASWADPGSYDTWSTPTQIDNNYGTDTINQKRGSYMLFRDDGTAEGELTYVFEHLDMDADFQPSNIGIAYATSSDGGETWDGVNDVPGADGSSGYYYFFPSGVTDQNNVNWHFFYYRDSEGDQRMVVTMLQDDDGWSGEVQIAGDLDGDPVDNHQFPMAAHYNNDGTNEIYMSCIYDNAGDFSDLTAGYVTGDYSSTNPPADGDFTTYDNVAGNDVSEEDMSAADILGKTAGEDGWIWTAYLETDTIFDVPNVNVARSDDKYNSVTEDYVTRDNYRKLNPSMTSHTVDGTSYAYVAYHSSHGTTRDVDHEVFLSILHSDWETEADTVGPETSHVSSNPNPVNLSTDSSFDLTASLDDTMTGGSDIQSAEYIETDTTVTDPTAIDWSGATGMSVSGTSPTEMATADGISIPAHWESGNTYRYWVRGQDTADNWGMESAGYVDIEVTGEGEVADPPTITLTNPTGGETWSAGNEEDITWDTTAGDGNIIGVDLEYTTDDGGTWTEIVTGTADDGSYMWTVPDISTTEARIRATVNDDNDLSDTDTSGIFTIEGTTPPEITITRPAGGEEWNAGDNEDIEWDTTAGDGAITGVDLDYSVDGGDSWTNIVTGTDDDGIHTWTVPDEPTNEAMIRGTVHDDNDLSHQNESGLFTILGTPPAPPENLNVEHDGTTTSTEELVENGTFPDNYDPWVLTEDQNDGTAEWDGTESYEEGGSIHVSLTEPDNAVSTEEARWEQSIGPTTSTLTVNGAYNMNLALDTGQASVDGTAEILVYDTGTEAWETVYTESNTDDTNTGWVEFGPDSTYTPNGEVTDIRAYMTVTVDGHNQGGGSGDIWMDNISATVETTGEGTEDNLVTWDASPDEPDVAEYNVYRSQTEDETGDYDLITTVNADESVNYSYVDTDRGTADDTLWWYRVHAVDDQGQDSDGVGPVQEPGESLSTFDIQLYEDADSDGWNFVSFNLVPENTGLTVILDDTDYGIDGNYDKVMYYDASTDEWLSYIPGRDNFNDDIQWDETKGLWIKMNTDDTLTVEGTEPTSTDITLNPGWNMVSYPSSTAAVEGTPTEVSIVGHFDAAQDNNLAYDYDPANFEFNPGEGYYLYNDADYDVNWSVEY